MSELILENREPKVGIFWVLDKQIIDFAKPVRNVNLVGGFADSPWDHYEVWDKVVAAHPKLNGKEYTDVPRGRVIYSGNDKTFHVITKKLIANNKPLISKILRTFSLPLQTKIVTDSHYEDNFDLDQD